MTHITKIVRMALVALLLAALVLPYTVMASSSTTVVTLWVGNNIMVVAGVRQPIDSDGTKPVIVEGRTLVPIRAVIEAFGGSVSWEVTTRKVSLSLGKNALYLWIGSSTASLNGIMLPIDEANPRVIPVIMSGRTMLPLRFVSESLGIDVQYEATSRMITLTYAVDTTPPLPAPLLVSPADGGKFVNESPRLSWLPSAGADASRVQILSSGAEVYAKSDLSGVDYVIPAGVLADGTYTWRVSVHNAAGWGAWSSSHTFTIVTVEPPAAPVLVAPDDNATVDASAVTLTWMPVLDATSYRVRVLLGENAVHEADDLTEASHTVPEGALLSNTYSWQAAAHGVGGWSAWSEKRTIKVREKLNVEDVAKFVDRIVKVTVQGSKDGSLFESSGSGFFTSQDGRVVTSYSILDYALSGAVTLNGGQHYNLVSVLGYDKARDVAVIKIGGADFPICELGDPSLLVTGEPIVCLGSPALLQSAISQGTVSAISTDAIHTTALAPSRSSGGPLFNMYGEVVGVMSSVAQAGGSLAVAVPISALSHIEMTDTGYTLKQVYQKEHGTVPEPPQPPILLLPNNAATVNPLDLTLTWKSSTGADKYTVWIGTGEAPTDPNEVLHEDTTKTSYAVPSTLLVPDGTYCWQVAAHNKNGWSDWSETRTLKTLPKSAIPDLTAPALSLPADKESYIPESGTVITFAWSEVAGAAEYVIWFGSGTTGEDSTEVLRDKTSGATYQLSSSTLSAGQVYTWAVYAVGSGGTTGPWSTDRHFSLVLLESPRLISPMANGAINLNPYMAAPTWRWSSANNANVYVLEVGTGLTAFQGTTVLKKTLVGETSYTLGSRSLLQFAGTRYFWWSVTAMRDMDYTVGIAWGFFYTVGG
jgi:S1-C subfamily serine protease